jgi:hypothetical protein
VSEKKKDGGPAFPVEQHDLKHGPHYGSPYDTGPLGVEAKTLHPGMTLRDYFAAHAPEMPSWFSANRQDIDIAERWFIWPWHYADQMLAEREKNGESK